MEKFAPDFITHVVFARREPVAKNPGLVDRFLEGLSATIAFMKTYKAETFKVSVGTMHERPAVAEKTYGSEVGGFIPDGTFDSKAVAVLKQSFIDMAMLHKKPEDDQMFTTQFPALKP